MSLTSRSHSLDPTYLVRVTTPTCQTHLPPRTYSHPLDHTHSIITHSHDRTHHHRYEREVLSAPGVMSQLAGTSFHTYSQGVWVPWNMAPWGNTTFFFPNQTRLGGQGCVPTCPIHLLLPQGCFSCPIRPVSVGKGVCPLVSFTCSCHRIASFVQ